MSRKRVSIVVIVVMAALIAARLTQTGGSDAGPDRQIVRWQGAVVSLPHSWQQAGTGSTETVWRSADGTHAVSIGAVEAADVPLATIVAATSDDLARSLTGYDPSTSRAIRLADGVGVEHRFSAGPSGQKSQVRQIWLRDREGGRDIICTWSSRSGQTPEWAVRSLRLS